MNKTVSIKKIKPNENNPRYITEKNFKKLVKSIKDDPWMLEVKPLVIDENNVVLGGNMRLKALEAAGVFEVPVKQVKDWTQEQKDAFIIKDNVSFGDWDYDILSSGYEVNLLLDWGFEPYQFGQTTDILDLDAEDDLEDESAKLPKITDDGFVKIEIILLEENKKKFISVLESIREDKMCTQGEALMELVNQYNNAGK